MKIIDSIAFVERKVRARLGGKVCGRWVCLYRAIDQVGQVIDMLVCRSGIGGDPPVFLPRARVRSTPVEVVTDRASAYQGYWMSCYPPAKSWSST
jgi:transposase-like protein